MQRTCAPCAHQRTAVAAALVPVRPAVAMRQCFKTAQPQQPSARGVVCQAQALDAEPLVVKGLDRAGQEDMLKVPKGYHWYETMMILRSALNDEDRDKELAKFEAFLAKEECLNVAALVRPAARLAYSIKNNWEGVYVLYTYAGKRSSARAVQQFLSKPDVGSEEVVLRHITFCKY